MHSRSILGSLIFLAYAGAAHAAGSHTVDNLTVFSGTKAASVQDIVQQHARMVDKSGKLDNLVLTKVQESLLGKHYSYQQMLHGLPVDRAQIVVSIGRNGDLLRVFNETRQVSEQANAHAANQLQVQDKISKDRALDIAWNNMKVQHPLVSMPTTDMVWVAKNDGSFQLTHKVQISAQMPTGSFVQYLNAQDGSLVDSYSTSHPRKGNGLERSIATRAAISGATLDRLSATQALASKGATTTTTATTATTAPAATVTVAPSGIDGTGNVFDPDPRTVLNTDNLSDTSPASAFELAYSTKALKDLTVTNGVYTLTGPWVNIQDIEAPNTAPSTSANGGWTAKRGEDAFDDTNVYFHLDQSQRYIQSLGFTGTKGILNRSMRADSNGVNGDDNSHYTSDRNGDYLAFGHGCVNDSEDADVILHEYGHGIQASIDANWTGGDTGGMGEGFGDYWAASYSYSAANGRTYHPEWAFSWDGHNACWAGRMLNRTDAKYNGSKTYGAHQSVTENGVTFQTDELWSAPLYASMVSLIGAGKSRSDIDKIILEAHFGLGSNVKMPAMATAIVNTAHNLFPNDSTFENTYRSKFEAQNILTPVIPLTNMNETESNNSIASANVISANNTLVSGNMSASSDTDYFKISLPAGKKLTATLTPNSTSDYDLALYNSSGTRLTYSSKGTSVADTVTYTNTGTTAKDVYAKVYYFKGGTGASSGTYTLSAAW